MFLGLAYANIHVATIVRMTSRTAVHKTNEFSLPPLEFLYIHIGGDMVLTNMTAAEALMHSGVEHTFLMGFVSCDDLNW